MHETSERKESNLFYVNINRWIFTTLYSYYGFVQTTSIWVTVEKEKYFTGCKIDPRTNTVEYAKSIFSSVCLSVLTLPLLFSCVVFPSNSTMC